MVNYKKKGQAAMEFLMTYGWAILVVLAAIGALAYFGVLSPDRFLPEKCTLPSGMACLDFKALPANAGFLLVIQNSGGYDMEGISVEINDTTDPASIHGRVNGSDGSSWTAYDSTILGNGQKSTYTINFTPGTLSAGKFKGAITIRYINKQTGIDHVYSGELIAKVE